MTRFASTTLLGLLLSCSSACGDDDGAPDAMPDTSVPGVDSAVPPLADGAVPPPADGGDVPPPPPGMTRIERYLRSTTDRRLVIEVDSVPGSEPRDGVLDQAITSIAPLLDKPDGIEPMEGGTVTSRGADHVWTVEELRETASASFDLEVPAGTIKLHVLFVDGTYALESPGTRTLGVALDDTHVVLFKARLTSTCQAGGAGPLLEDQLCTLAEVSVLVHETGHAIGLVNNGLAMVAPHEDTEHRAHDTNRDCVMYWAYEGGDIIPMLLGRLVGGDSGPLPFDDACLADIAAVRER